MTISFHVTQGNCPFLWIFLSGRNSQWGVLPLEQVLSIQACQGAFVVGVHLAELWWHFGAVKLTCLSTCGHVAFGTLHVERVKATH